MKDSITIEDIERIAREIQTPSHQLGYFNQYRPFNFAGISVHEAKVTMVPKIQVSENFKWLTDDDRLRINAKLVELLGCREQCAVPKGIAYMLHNDIIVARSGMFNMINTCA